jgi:diadenosine tetraphosphate (Ap4A) HIT family hydrolase
MFPGAGALGAAEGACGFCAIAAGAGTAPATVVYRDERVVAFMDRAPRNPGHVLVVPREHAADALAVPPETLGHMAQVAQRIAQAIRRTDLKAEGFNLIANNGKAAGQTVFHPHLHVVPRFAGEPAAVAGEQRPVQPAEELAAVAAKIRAALAR